MRSLLTFLLMSCAPAAHLVAGSSAAASPESQSTPRPLVASTLASADPLSAKTCELPTAPDVTCPVVEPEPERPPVHHHEPEAAPAPVVAPPTRARAAPAKVIDPVCGMSIDPATAKGGSVTVGGKTSHFCSSACRRTFLSRDGGTP